MEEVGGTPCYTNCVLCVEADAFFELVQVLRSCSSAERTAFVTREVFFLKRLYWSVEDSVLPNF